MIMRGCAVHIRPKPPQQFDLALAKPRDVGERLRPRENRQKNQEQYLRERIIHFAGLTMIRQLAEIVKKTRRLRNRRKSCPLATHLRPPPPTQWMTTDSALQHFVTNLFTRLPWEKQVELLTQAFPDRTRLAMLWDALSADQFSAAERRAKSLRLEV